MREAAAEGHAPSASTEKGQLVCAESAWSSVTPAARLELLTPSLGHNRLGDLARAAGDPVGARRWFERAAAAGDTGAAYNLGLLLATQLDPPDLVEARHWYTAAAEAGHTGAVEARSQLQPELGE